MLNNNARELARVCVCTLVLYVLLPSFYLFFLQFSPHPPWIVSHQLSGAELLPQPTSISATWEKAVGNPTQWATTELN